MSTIQKKLCLGLGCGFCLKFLNLSLSKPHVLPHSWGTGFGDCSIVPGYHLINQNRNMFQWHEIMFSAVRVKGFRRITKDIWTNQKCYSISNCISPLFGEISNKIVQIKSFTVYSEQYSENSVYCTLYTVRCTVYSVHFTVYSVQGTVYSVECTVYSV